MTAHQKEVQNTLRKLEDSNRILAWYEASIRELELRAQRADKTSAKRYKTEIADLKKEKVKFEDDVQKAKELIETCTDARGKRILQLRYISMKRMEDIAYIMSYERTHLYRIYYKALDNIQQMKH